MSNQKISVSMKILQVLIYASLLLKSSGEDVEEYASDIGLNAKGLILKYGYPYKGYTVRTDDGYLLTVQRIPYGKNHTRNLSNRIPILLMPGLFCDSSTFVNIGAKSLAFILADNGYNVWIANHRGSTLSKRHVTLNSELEKDKKEYWNFSFHEMGMYDIPKCIDYILKMTKHKRLHYIGHSQGTTSYFAMLSDKPEYANKIRSVVALAPTTTNKYTISPVKMIFSSLKNITKNYAEVYQDYELLPRLERMSTAGKNLCGVRSPLVTSCVDVVLLIVGWTPAQFRKERIPVILTNTPSGASIKEIQHYLQLKDTFHKFDYGVEENIKRYGQEFPPDYNLTKATPPTAIYYGDTDWLTHYKEVENWTSQIPNVVRKKLCRGFNHIDMMWGIDAPKIIFEDILKFLKRYK